MNMQKGIVIETTNAYSIFLTSDGLFEKGIPLNSSVLIGEEVYFRPYQNIKQRKMKGSYRSQWMTPILSVVATIVLLFSVLLPAQSNVSAYVQIDINPSIELGISNAGNVYSFKGMNDDGLAIKRDISFWKGKPLSWVLLQIVDRTESLIIKKEVIEITTIYQNDKAHDKLENVIETAVVTSTKQILPKKSVIKVNEATVSDWKSATNKGISVQKYKKDLNEKYKEKREKVKTEVQKTETKKKNNNSKVNDKGTKEKKEPKNEKPTPQKKSMTNEKQSNKDVQKKQQNNGKKEKSKENQKVNDQTYKNEQTKEKNNMKQQNKQKSKSTETKDTKSNFSNNSSDVKGNEKKNKNVKVAKKLKSNEIKHREQGNNKEIKHKSNNKKH